MLNIYNVEKKIERNEKQALEEQKMIAWHQWKVKKEAKWLDNHQNKIGKFLHYVLFHIKILQLSEKPERYRAIFERRVRRNQYKETNVNDPLCVGPPYFIFREAITEKDRIKQAIKEHEYLQTEPLGKGASRYEFRERIRSKEIQPDMKFTSKRIFDPKTSTNESIKIPKSNSHEAIFNMGFNFKSAFSLMFSKSQFDLTKSKANAHIPLINHNEAPAEHASPLIIAAKTALKRCKYIANKKDFSSPQALTKPRFSMRDAKYRMT